MREEISMHLHFDAEFLEAHPTLHLYFHLQSGVPQPAAFSHKKDVHLMQVTSDWPQEGATVKVNTTSGNSICAYGQATNPSGGLSQIMAYIYQGSCPASIPNSPVSGATPGQVITAGTLSADYRANYFFQQIPGAGCDSNGMTNNCLVVWAQYYGCTGWEKTQVNFKGICASQTDCTMATSHAPIESFCPKQYRLWVCPDECSAAVPATAALAQIAAFGPIELRYCSKRSTPAAPQWLCDDARCGEWSLRMTTLGNQSRAVLKCHRLPNVPLVSALLWETSSCEPYDSNRLAPVSPALLRDSRTSCVIEPA